MKNKLIIILMSLVLIMHVNYAQAPAIEWQKCLGGTNTENYSSIQQTSDGGYIVAGSTNSTNGDVIGNHGNYDVWVVKLSSNSSIQWKKCLGGTADDYAYNIKQTSDGGYIVAGDTKSTDGDIIGNHGYRDAWIVKLSNTGTIQWQKCLGGSNGDTAINIQQTSDDGFIILGNTASSDGDVSGSHSGGDIWVVKLSSNSTIAWQVYLGGTYTNGGGTGYEVPNCIRQTTDGGYIMVAYTNSVDGDVIGNHGNIDAWLVKLSDTGSIQWQKCLGGTNDDYAYSIQQTNDGGYIMAGETTSTDGDVNGNHGSSDVWIVKLSSTGILEWQKCLGGTGGEGARSIQVTSESGYIIAGSTYSNNGDVSGNHSSGFNDFWVVKTSNMGTIQWQQCLGGSSLDGAFTADSIQQTTDGGYILTGLTRSNDGDVSGLNGLVDIWVSKLFTDPLEISAYDNSKISIAPNPASTHINIHFNNISELNGGTLKVINSLGQQVATTPITISGTQTSMQLNTWGGAGMYFVQIINPQGQIVDIKKIILQ